MKDYSHLKGTEIELINHLGGHTFTDCFLAEIHEKDGLTIEGFNVEDNEQQHAFCIRSHDPQYDKQMKYTIEAIEKGVFDMKDWEKMLKRGKRGGGTFQPTCAFE